MNIARQILLSFVLGLSVTATARAAASTCPLPREDIRYIIFNNEDDVGALDLTFTGQGGNHVLNVAMDARVRILFIEATASCTGRRKPGLSVASTT